MALKIGILSHYGKMKEDFAFLAKTYNCEIIFKMGVLELAKEKAVELEEKYNVDAIIAVSSTCEVIKDMVNIPLIPTHFTNNNLFSAFSEAKKIGKKIVFSDVVKDYPTYDFDFVKSVMDFDISHYSFEQADESKEIIDRCIEERKDVIVTPASCMIANAKRKNIKTVLLEFQVNDIKDAIERAVHIVNIRKKEIEKMQWLNEILNNSTDGLIVINASRKVQLINDKASSLIGLKKSELLNQSILYLKNRYVIIEKILKVDEEFEIIYQDSKGIVVRKNDIFSSSDYNGTLITISELKDIQNIENQARRKLIDNGFVAKYSFDDIEGESNIILKTKEKAKKYAKTSSNIILYGESGCGKEFFAQSIHNYSNWSKGSFVAINCATLPENLLESELFGYEDGAFSGAKKGGKQGLFELAHDGTLFLDEIGEMPIILQSRLLRVLQEKTIRRVGGSRNIYVNVRIIAATNRNLINEVSNGTFRRDLFYRLNVLSINIPALRERKEDAPIIARSILNILNKNNNTKVTIPDNFMMMLVKYEWPGNIRELNNFVERIWAVMHSSDYFENTILEIYDELNILNNKKTEGKYKKVKELDINKKENIISIPITNIKDMENNIIKQVIELTDGNLKLVEQMLGMSTTTLWRKTKALDI
nr:sigma 54-interacting transcriptional regulator [Sedimentibacter sp.]